MLPKQIEHLSHSSIAKYTTCGESYRRKYIAQEPHFISPNLVFGSAMHKVAEAIICGDVSDPVEQWKAAYKEAVGANPILFDDTSYEEQEALGINIFTSYDVLEMLSTIHPRMHTVQDPETGETVTVPAVEQYVDFIHPAFPTPIIGYIDVICDDGVPLDIKSAGRMWAADKAGNEIQPLFYLHALNQRGDYDHKNRFRHLVITKAANPKVALFETVREPRELDFMLRMTEAAHKGIEAGVFVPNPNSWLCGPKYCEFYSTCRLGMPVEDVPTTPAAFLEEE